MQFPITTCNRLTCIKDKTGGKKEYLPQIHYTYTDLSNQFPPLTVDFPMPIVTFGTKALPTFVNKENNVMVQFDLNDILQMGWYSISFQPNEF